MNFTKFLMGQFLLMDEKKDPPGGGGGDPKPDPKDDEIKKLKEELEKLKKPPVEDPTLADKVRKEREETEKKTNHEKSLESALHFNLKSGEFLKSNKGLLPESVESLFVQAEKESYDSAIDKSNAIKVGIIQEFFAIQANHDLLTAGQKNELEQFLKLTKNSKQEKAATVYSMIFEPTLETLRKIEKAKQLHSGGKDQTDNEKAYAEKMLKLGKERYLGGK